MRALPKSVFAALRANAVDALPRVVWIGRARTPRVARRRVMKAALLAKRDVTQEPYMQSDPRNQVIYR